MTNPQGARTRPWLKWLGLTAVGCVAAVVVVGLLATVGLLSALPPAADFREPNRVSITILDREGRLLAFRGVSPGGTVALSAMPAHLPAAFLAIEDRRFRSHSGVDPLGIGRAVVVNAGAGSWEQGASTITQQLVKNRYLTSEKTLTRKAQEALIAIWLERHLDKDAILERYLNSLYLGAGAYGVEAASRRYFGKPAAEVSLAESAMLAGLAQSPSRTAPTLAGELARERAALVLDAMVETGAITAEQAADAKARPATLVEPAVTAAAIGHAADWVASETRNALGDIAGAITVRTTIDAGLQTLAADVVRRMLETEGTAIGATQAALFAMRPDGQVVAVIGGVDYGATQFNRAVQARRQPGSLFKLFVYLAALRSGLAPESMIDDTPITIDGWTPDNYTQKTHGRVAMRDAFAHSYNIAAVRLQEQVGRRSVIDLARSMGIAGPMAPVPSLALGTTEVTLAEITAAFAAVRAGTDRITPQVIQVVSAAAGSALGPVSVAQTATPSATTAAALTLLRAAVENGTGRAARLDTATYGKTGTTQDYRDAWFIGFAGDLVVGVWIGNDDNTPMRDAVGGGLPARIWKAFMVDALKGRAVVPPLPVAAPPEPPMLEARARVIDSGTLRLGGQTVRLLGVVGAPGIAARGLRDYIGDRIVNCRVVTGVLHRCEVDGWDLSEVVLFNGGGRATADAPPAYQRAEQKAKAERVGMWAGGG